MKTRDWNLVSKFGKQNSAEENLNLIHKFIMMFASKFHGMFQFILNKYFSFMIFKWL